MKVIGDRQLRIGTGTLVFAKYFNGIFIYKLNELAHTRVWKSPQ